MPTKHLNYLHTKYFTCNGRCAIIKAVRDAHSCEEVRDGYEKVHHTHCHRDGSVQRYWL